MRKYFPIRPAQHGLYTDNPALDIPYPSASWPIKNVKIDQRSISKRHGYSVTHRNLSTAIGGTQEPDVQHIILFEPTSGSRFTVYLTRDDIDTDNSGTTDAIAGDLCVKRTGDNETYSYNTETLTYTTKITNITGDTVTTVGEDFGSDGVDAGDYFILDDDIVDVNKEFGLVKWTPIESAGTTTLTLKSTYSGTTGAFGSPKTALVRRTFKVPSGDRYSYAIVSSSVEGTLSDFLCFTSLGDNVKYWTGAGFASDLDSTYAVKARFCIEYAERLIIADHGSSRDPLGIAWSKNGDPGNWTDSTSGAARLVDTGSFITGLGKVGANLIIFKRESLVFGYKTGNPTSPLEFSQERPGIGCVAPYSIVEFLGTNAFLGRDDFYMLDGEMPVSIGEPIRHKFFEIVGDTEVERVWGVSNLNEQEIWWSANTSEGYFQFVWNYQYKQWYVYEFKDTIMSMGKGVK